jgi:hypothetical protein
LDGAISIEDLNTTILVQSAEQPIISIKGPESQPLEEEALLHGYSVLGQVSILSMTRQEKEEMDSEEISAKVSFSLMMLLCVIHILLVGCEILTYVCVGITIISM